MISTRRWLENQTIKNDDGSSHASSIEEEESVHLDDLLLIDNRTSFQRKYNFLESDSSDEDIESETCGSGNESDMDDINEKIELQDKVRFDGMADFDYRRSPYQQPILTNEQKQSVEEDLKLLRCKGIYPYEYFYSMERFQERKLPPIEAFNSQINAGRGITIKEYEHAQRVFQHFQMETLQDYHNLYLLQDIFLLDDILTAFRTICLNTYGLYRMHYHTAPGLTWDAR